MSSFVYKAIDKQGRPARGALEAANEVDLELRLRRMGLDLITYRVHDKPAARGSRGRVSRIDLITFCIDMEQIARAGIPLMDGLRDLREGMENPRFREILTTVIEDMEGGKVLSQCLGAHPEVFSPVFVSLIRAGELAGTLPEVFESLGASLRWQDELASMTKRLMIYPTLVLLVVSAVVLFLLMWLVPQITQLIKTMRVEIPIQTRMLTFLSDALRAWWPAVLGVPILIALPLFVWIHRSEKARYLWDYAKLRMPLTGPILQKIILARFASFFAMMYRSGITVLEALRNSEEIVGNRVIADGLRRATQQITAGDSVAEAFQNTGIFPALVVRMLRLGETTGALDTALMNVNYFYGRDVRESVDKAMKLIEPALTVALGLILAFILWAVLAPVYDILGKLKI
ncbi:MAG: type II secretion system F family protein [Betaproteobacteria bacterium]|nr:MAG: type II secretion system F family protein [Betaproteobacteria bacterium]